MFHFHKCILVLKVKGFLMDVCVCVKIYTHTYMRTHIHTFLIYIKLNEMDIFQSVCTSNEVLQ